MMHWSLTTSIVCLFLEMIRSVFGISINPLIPDENAYSPYCSPYILYGTSKENLSKYQDILSLVIVSFILITWMFEQAVIM